MVSRAYGTANGLTISFERTTGDHWQATVPWEDDGEYAVELFAEDEAGNTAYLCTVLFVISGHELRGYIVPRGYAGAGGTTGYGGNIGKVEYQGTVKEGGYTIERTVCSKYGH